MAKAKPKSIVLCGDYNGNKDVLFMMAHDDFRFNTDNYRLVTGGRYDHKVKVFVGDNGVTYQVWSDWSAEPVPAREKGRDNGVDCPPLPI